MFAVRSGVRACALAAAFLAMALCAPTAAAQSPTLDDGPPQIGSGGAQPGQLNTRPSITGLNATQVPGKKFRFTGTVSDNTPASCVVVFSGAASGVAMCNASGQFDGTFDVQTLGVVTAVANDGSQNSNPVNRTLTNNAPTVTVQAVQGPNNTWTFSGTVVDEAPAGITVVLNGCAGVNGQTVTVLANGTYSLALTLSPTASGFVNATATDHFGATGSGQTYFGP
jgi:hypothetical protein